MPSDWLLILYGICASPFPPFRRGRAFCRPRLFVPCMPRTWVFLSFLEVVMSKLATDFVENFRPSRLLFGSCHKLKYDNYDDFWSQILPAQQGDAFLWMGDAIYPPTKEIASLELLESEYQQMKAVAGYASFAESVPIYGTWDDHDYGANDGDYDMPDKEARADLFYDFLGRPRPSGRPGVYSSVAFTDNNTSVQVTFLDTRWSQDHRCIPSIAGSSLGAGIACVLRWLSWGLAPGYCPRDAPMLNEQQWKWLEGQLTLKTDVHVVVSSLQVLTTNAAMEGWGHFPAERDRLIRLLAQVPNVVLLSGDVHFAEVSDASKLLEVTSSGLTHDCSTPFYGALCQPLLDYFAGQRSNPSNYYIGRNFGSIDFDWEQREYTVNVHSVETGEVVLSKSRRLVDQPIYSVDEVLASITPSMDSHLVPLARKVAVGVLLGVLVGVLLFRIKPRGQSPRLRKSNLD